VLCQYNLNSKSLLNCSYNAGVPSPNQWSHYNSTNPGIYMTNVIRWTKTTSYIWVASHIQLWVYNTVGTVGQNQGAFLLVNHHVPSSSVCVKLSIHSLSRRLCSLVLSLAMDAQPKTLGKALPHIMPLLIESLP
jgi:hypothetical protein